MQAWGRVDSVGGGAQGEGAHGKELCLRFSRTVWRLFLVLSYPLPPLLSFSITKGIERHAGKNVSGSLCSHHPCEHRANWVSSESRLCCELPGEGQGDWTVRDHSALLRSCFGAAQGSRTPAARSSFEDRTGVGQPGYCTWWPWGSCPRFGPRGPQVGACGLWFGPRPPRARARLGQRGLRAREGQEKAMPRPPDGQSIVTAGPPRGICVLHRASAGGALTPPHTWILHLLNVKARAYNVGVLETQGFPGGSADEASACSAGDLGSIPGLGRVPGVGNGNPLQYSFLEKPMDRGGWRATVHGVAKSRT